MEMESMFMKAEPSIQQPEWDGVGALIPSESPRQMASSEAVFDLSQAVPTGRSFSSTLCFAGKESLGTESQDTNPSLLRLASAPHPLDHPLSPDWLPSHLPWNWKANRGISQCPQHMDLGCFLCQGKPRA